MRIISTYTPPILLLLLLIAFSVSGCATQSFEPKALESIHSVSLTSDALHISVSSHGCTKKDDFKIDSYQEQNKHIRIERLKYDGCRRRKHLVKFSFTLKEIGVTSDEAIVLDNPIKAFAKPGFANYHKSSK